MYGSTFSAKGLLTVGMNFLHQLWNLSPLISLKED